MIDEETLRAIYERRTTPDGYGDKGTAHSYIDTYERLLAPIRASAKNVLEIGVGPDALSLRMWAAYFPNASVWGVDVHPVIATDLPDRVTCLQADAYDPATATFLACRRYDLIIDDGSHALADQLAFVRFYRPLLAPNGLLVVEDVMAINALCAEVRPGPPAAVYDFRHVKGRYDDVLVVFQAVERP